MNTTQFSKRATIEWVRAVFNSMVNQEFGTFRGNEWVPQLITLVPLSGGDKQIIELRQSATRMEFLQVWCACGGEQLSEAMLNRIDLETK